MSDCIEWQGNISGGYGRVPFDGKRHRVHRLAYRLYHDLDEDKMPEVIRHICDNPRCYNVEHLVGGTHVDNQQDKADRQRSLIGTKNHKAKLTDSDVVEIRRRLAAGESQPAIAEDFGVTRHAICRINIGSTWTHIPRRQGGRVAEMTEEERLLGIIANQNKRIDALTELLGRMVCHVCDERGEITNSELDEWLEKAAALLEAEK